MNMGLRSFGRWVSDWYRQQKLALRALLLAIPLLIGKIVDQALDLGKTETGWPQWLIASAVICACLVSVVVSLSLHRSHKLDPLPPIDLDELEVCRTFAPSELMKLRIGLHKDIYGGIAPDAEQIDRMYAKNPRMGVALFDPVREDYVAFATGWPLTDEIAERLIAGLVTENDLTSADVLRAVDNAVANYVLVPAFGAAGMSGSAERKLLGVKLNFEFRKALRQNFFGNAERNITLIASGFSPDGRRWCRRRGMIEESQVHMDDVAEPIPIFTKRISLADVD